MVKRKHSGLHEVRVNSYSIQFETLKSLLDENFIGVDMYNAFVDILNGLGEYYSLDSSAVDVVLSIHHLTQDILAVSRLLKRDKYNLDCCYYSLYKLLKKLRENGK